MLQLVKGGRADLRLIVSRPLPLGPLRYRLSGLPAHKRASHSRLRSLALSDPMGAA